MEPNELVPLLLVFGTILMYSMENNMVTAQIKRNNFLQIAGK